MTTCHRCGQKGERSERFDAYFCGRCGLWLEGACGDPKCSFCTERPPAPPTVEQEPSATKPATYDAALGFMKAENVRLTKRRGVTMAELREQVYRISADGPVAYVDGGRVSTSAIPPENP